MLIGLERSPERNPDPAIIALEIGVITDEGKLEEAVFELLCCEGIAGSSNAPLGRDAIIEGLQLRVSRSG